MTSNDSPKSALLLGATGLVGGHCLHELLSNPAFGHVIVLARRPAVTADSRLDWRVIDFENLADQAEQFDVDVVFSCLGSTKQNAGSTEAFRKIDFGYVLTAAQLASQMGTQAFLVVSSAGRK